MADWSTLPNDVFCEYIKRITDINILTKNISISPSFREKVNYCAKSITALTSSVAVSVAIESVVKFSNLEETGGVLLIVNDYASLELFPKLIKADLIINRDYSDPGHYMRLEKSLQGLQQPIHEFKIYYFDEMIWLKDGKILVPYDKKGNAGQMGHQIRRVIVYYKSVQQFFATEDFGDPELTRLARYVANRVELLDSELNVILLLYILNTGTPKLNDKLLTLLRPLIKVTTDDDILGELYVSPSEGSLYNYYRKMSNVNVKLVPETCNLIAFSDYDADEFDYEGYDEYRRDLLEYIQSKIDDNTKLYDIVYNDLSNVD